MVRRGTRLGAERLDSWHLGARRDQICFVPPFWWVYYEDLLKGRGFANLGGLMERLGRFLGAFFGAFLCIVLLMGIYSIAEEEITLTTYYPAPYGAYDAMYSTTLGVGDNDGNSVLGNSGDTPDPATKQGDVWIKGNVGIGTMAPERKLDVNGDLNVNGDIYIPEVGRIRTDDELWIHLNDNSEHVGAFGIYNGADVCIFFVNESTGNVGIGTTNPGAYKLYVNGNTYVAGDVVTDANTYPDYVFEPGYNLMLLSDIKSYVITNKHLPNMPSSEEVKKD